MLCRTRGVLTLESVGFTVKSDGMLTVLADGLRMHPLTFAGIYHSGKNSNFKVGKKLPCSCQTTPGQPVGVRWGLGQPTGVQGPYL